MRAFTNRLAYVIFITMHNGNDCCKAPLRLQLRRSAC